MTATETSGTEAPPPLADTSVEVPPPGPTDGGGLFSDHVADRLAVALTVTPFVVGALALLVAVRGQYNPVSDHALTELQTRSVGRDEVLVGLYSRDGWNHPGPALFYVLAPFYWLTGGMSIGISLGALAINGASVAAMGVVARRRGGTPLMLVTLLACSLLMRMLGAEFLQDPWNCFVTTLPFGLLVLLSWSMWSGDVWAFPVAAGVATFLAQSHVGFVVLATPLLAWGAAGLVATTALEPDGRAREAALWRSIRPGVVGVAVLVVGWLPAVVEAIVHSPSNIEETLRWFRHPDQDAHTIAEGWRVMSGQFGGVPEWLTVKRGLSFAGQSPFIGSAPVPWMLLVLAVAGAVLWRRDVRGARSLLTTMALAFGLGVIAVARTVGPAFDYRLRWSYVPAMLGLVAIAWAGWTVVAGRWPRAGSRVLTPVALAGLAALAGVNTVTAATAGTPQNDDSLAVRSLTEQVLDNLPDTSGTVLITDAAHSGAWQARGLLLQLERRGIDVGVDASLSDEYGRHRVADPGEVGTVLVVTRDGWVDDIASRPGMRLIAEWWSRPRSEIDDLLARSEQATADVEAGRISYEEAARRQAQVAAKLTNGGQSSAYKAAVFVDEGFAPPAPAPG